MIDKLLRTRQDALMISRVERFLAHLDRLSRGVEPAFTPFRSSTPDLDQATVMTYSNHPSPGYLVGYTYGLSLADHPAWRNGSRELSISVRSTDRLWAMAAGHLAETLRGKCPFGYGNTIDFGEPISPESRMTAFVIYEPTIADPQDFRVDVSPEGHEGHDVINIVGLYPIHDV
ncbi:MAG: suppressor of fused domain protein [Streptomyces sp.]|uniref:suppressor of fused domain protein n=1 Tax=Streptomyces sp. TaxID=1931 RepID=UPI0025E41C09|nr:suppressor of fused domain protein [Streptomyces sp.]MBW8801870.1 suppressor of fused domain protein [Streptomyces sp.]